MRRKCGMRSAECGVAILTILLSAHVGQAAITSLDDIHFWNMVVTAYLLQALLDFSDLLVRNTQDGSDSHAPLPRLSLNLVSKK